MPLPRGDEYQIAVQNPKTAFNDSELRACTVETTPLGLPKPYAGGFTTTYHFLNTTEQWAVRCFTREIPDLQARYQAIFRFQSKNKSGYFVDATCLTDGICIGNQRYPIIKMEWVKGDPLNVFIGKNLSSPDQITKITEEFIKLVKSLENLKIAHGDLQHGNIIVKNGKLFLIDYDGIFLPELVSYSVNEIGHINYQHPSRTDQHYNASIDRFSAIVIYLGLKATSIAPHLWRKYDDSENILFRRDDFTELTTSPLLKDLASLSQLQPLVDRFKGVCNLEFNRLPTLDQFVSGSFTYSKVLTPIIPAYPKRSQYPIYQAFEKGALLEHIGDRVEVIGEITDCRESQTRYKQPYMFLNFGKWPNQTFTLVLWSNAIKEFKTRNVDPISFVGKTISIVGVISSYKDKPQIVVEMPSQIQVMQSEEAIKGKFISPATVPPSVTPVKPVATPKSPSISVSTSKVLNPDIPITKHEAKSLNDLWGKQGSVITKKKPQQLVSASAPTNKPSTISKQDAQVLTSLYGTQKPKLVSSPSVMPSTPGKATKKQKSKIKFFIYLAGALLLVFIGGGIVLNLIGRQPVKLNLPTGALMETQRAVSEDEDFLSPTPKRQFTLTPVPTKTLMPSPTNALIEGCASGNLNVRKGPGIDYRVIDWLLDENCLLFDARTESGDWLRIAPDQSVKIGWVNNSNMKFNLTPNSLLVIDLRDMPTEIP